ncbi:MAG: TonB family protein [Terriglobales bacterium]|jgi:TonB family protein
MKTRKRSISMGLSLLIIIFHAYTLVAQQNEMIDDKDINVTSFAEMRYPQLARQARIQGIVVVRVKLDNVGSVISTAAISGSRLLVSDTLSNAKKWEFRPNSSKAAVIIYEFRLADGTCKSSEQNHISTFREPNILSVIGCEAMWQP